MGMEFELENWLKDKKVTPAPSTPSIDFLKKCDNDNVKKPNNDNGQD